MVHWILVDEHGQVRRRAIGHCPPAIAGHSWHEYIVPPRMTMAFRYEDVQHEPIPYRPLDFGGMQHAVDE